MKIQLCFLILCLILTMALIDAYALPSDLVIYLPLDEGKGEEVADAAGNGHNGAIVGDFNWIDGKYGKALELAADAEVQVPDNKELDGMKELTIEVWVRQDTHQSTGIIQKGANWPNISYLMQPWSDQQVYFGVKDTSSRAITKPGDYPLKEWYHLTGTYDGSTLKIYINGEEKASAPAPVKAVPDTPEPLQVGNRLLGAIDEFVLYTRALSVGEIQDDMNGKLLSVTPKGKLAVCWGNIKAEK